MRKIHHAILVSLMSACALQGQENTPPPAPLAPSTQQDGTTTQPVRQKPPDPPPADPPSDQPALVNPPTAANTVDKRVFGVIPNNRTTSADLPYNPITAGRKIVIALKDSFDWPSYITGGLFAGLYQLDNSNPSFGQGAAGYFRRFGTASADQVIGNMFTEGFVPAAFHQDPRYFQLGPGNGTFKHRLWHALIGTSVARMDSGKMTFNFSEWGGNAIGVAISNAYYPDSRNAVDNVQKLFIAVGTDTFSNVAKEFWPDVKLWWKRKHSHSSDPATSTGLTDSR